MSFSATVDATVLVLTAFVIVIPVAVPLLIVGAVNVLLVNVSANVTNETVPVASTVAENDNTTKIATTAYGDRVGASALAKSVALGG